jgi:hypothetical protein
MNGIADYNVNVLSSTCTSAQTSCIVHDDSGISLQDAK